MRAAFLVSTFLILSCAGLIPEQVSERPQEIRSFNLKAVFDYLASRDDEYNQLLHQKKNIEEQIDLAEQNEALSELELLKEKLQEFAEEEERVKLQIYAEIERAVTSYASRNGIDFIFNTTEGGIYADRKYDITEEIVFEIRNIERRRGPASR